VVWSEDFNRRYQVQPKALVWFDRCFKSDECGRVATISMRFKLDENSYPKLCRASGSFAAFVASVPRRRRLVKAEAEIVQAVQTLGRCGGDAICAAQRCDCEEGQPIASRQRASSCLHTDAPQEFYAAVLTKMPVEDLEKHIDEERHERLAFISGRFVRSSYNWSVPEKEAFTIVAAGPD
jgi:RNase H-like domain found in reverse transcriptase